MQMISWVGVLNRSSVFGRSLLPSLQCLLLHTPAEGNECAFKIQIKSSWRETHTWESYQNAKKPQHEKRELRFLIVYHELRTPYGIPIRH